MITPQNQQFKAVIKSKFLWFTNILNSSSVWFTVSKTLTFPLSINRIHTLIIQEKNSSCSNGGTSDSFVKYRLSGKDYYSPINHTKDCSWLHNQCLEDHSALSLELYSSSILFHPRTFCCLGVNLSHILGVLFYLLSYITSITCPYYPYCSGCSLRAEAGLWNYCEAQCPTHSMLSTRMHYMYSLAVYRLKACIISNSTLPVTGWHGAFPHPFSWKENRSLMTCSRPVNSFFYHTWFF